MKSESGTKYGTDLEGTYKLEFTRHPVVIDWDSSPQAFHKARKLQIERCQKTIELEQNEIARLEELK